MVYIITGAQGWLPISKSPKTHLIHHPHLYINKPSFLLPNFKHKP